MPAQINHAEDWYNPAMKTIRVAKLDPKAFIPTRKYAQDAGLDIYSNVHLNIEPHSIGIVSTGITIEIKEGFAGILKPKGRNDHLLGAGVVDAGYQGEILVKVANITDHVLEIKPGDAVGQLVILPVLTPAVVKVDKDEIHNDQSLRAGSGGIVSQFKS